MKRVCKLIGFILFICPVIIAVRMEVGNTDLEEIESRLQEVADGITDESELRDVIISEAMDVLDIKFSNSPNYQYKQQNVESIDKNKNCAFNWIQVGCIFLLLF